MVALRLCALVFAVALGSAPVMALERLVLPATDASLVTPVADLETTAIHTRADRWRDGGNRRGWRMRAAYTRWLHNEYVHAGYPVRSRQFRTYVRVVPCCWRGRYRHW